MSASASGAPAASRSASARASDHQLIAGDDLRHEPEPQRLRGVDRVADQRQLGGLRRPDEPWQEPRRAAVGHEADPAECEHEPRLL